MKYCLTIRDLDDQKDHRILETDAKLSHPVFHPDGDAIIALSEVGFVWIDLDAPELLEIETGACFAAAPGHGVSADGAWFYFTDRTLTGLPTVYRLALGEEGDPEPVSGGMGQHFLGFDAAGEAVMGDLPVDDMSVEAIELAGPKEADKPSPWSPDGRAFAFVASD